MTDGRQILLIEDSETQALKVMATLEGDGFEVHRAVSAEEALDRLGTVRPDLIMVDYHLPGMRGDEFCRHIRMNKGMESIPLLILTDDIKGEVERQALESGADDHISKAMAPGAILARIHALLRNGPHTFGFSGNRNELFRKARILTVDDSPTYLAFLSGELEQDGYVVQGVASGEEALDTVHRETFDCIVVDLVMPGIDGIELCRRLDAFRRSASLAFPLLMVTGKDSNDEMMRALEAGADDFVSKSSDIAIVRARIRAMLRRKFLHDAHQRIISEFRGKELEILHERSEREAAEGRAALVEQLEAANAILERNNRDLKEMQSQLVQTAKMASLGELVAGIAHEINNPLSFVMNHTGTIKSRLQQIAPRVEAALDGASRQKWAKVLERLSDVGDGLERVKDLVIKLRTFSRLDEGAFKTVDIHQNIESTLSLVQHRCKGAIRIERRYASDGTLACYPGPLNQVVMNVLSNAIDAIEGEGRIAIRTRRAPSTFEISISDTGKGIPREIRDRVFDPFFTTKAVGDGTGLGLAISYRIVEAHKGRIRVKDRRGRGTEVIVEIPTNLEEERRS